MEAVEDVALLEEVALGRVDVLALERVVVVQLARLEADHAPPRVCEREHQPLWEVVPPALVREARSAQLVGAETLLPGLAGKSVSRREAQPEFLRHRLAESAARQVGPHGLSIRSFPQVPLEERGRLVENGIEALPLPPRVVRHRRALLVLERHPEPLGEPLDRPDEVETLGLPDERDDVAALAATEAVVEVQVRVDGEARRPLLVERAAAHVARPRRLAERRAQADHVDDVRCGDDLAHALILDPRHQLAPA